MKNAKTAQIKMNAHMREASRLEPKSITDDEAVEMFLKIYNKDGERIKANDEYLKNKRFVLNLFAFLFARNKA